MRRAAITVSGLRKAYGDKVVLDGVGFQVAEGSVFALLGPGGAGKTTTVGILSTLMPADAGTVRIAGHDVTTARERAHAAAGAPGRSVVADGRLSGRENLLLAARLKRVRDGGRLADRLLERFELVDVADRSSSAYSVAMRRKLDLAVTLVGDPEVILLDEPTAGLDPRGRRTMWGIVRELVTEGITVLLTTRDPEEADRTADRVAVLDRGRLTAEGTPEELRRRVHGAHIRLRFADQYEFLRACRVLAEAARDDEELVLRVPGDGGTASLRDLVDRLDVHEIEAQELWVHRPDPATVLSALTGRAAG